MKTVIFAQEDQEKFSEYVRPYKHQSIALSPKSTRPMFIPDYHAPLDTVYENNGYNVIKKTVSEACTDNKPFIYLISPQPNIFTLLKENPQSIHKFFMSIDKGIITAVNQRRCAFIIHNCKEQYAGNYQIEQKLHKLLSDIGFETKNIIIVENSPNASVSNFFHFVQWNYFETAVRLLDPTYKHPNYYSTGYKKFLCLNFTPRYHRKDFMYRMRDLNLLGQFNASHNDEQLPLSYDVDDHNISLNDKADIIPSSGHIPMLVKNVNHWNKISPRLKNENLIFIVTETPFQSDELLFITEKTWKPILLKMPFILLSNAGSLKYLKSIGFKTFDHMWSEKYDSILDEYKRLNEICNLVESLSKLDNSKLKELINNNMHVLEHNYNLLLSRRPEQVVFDAVDKIISHQ